MKRTNIFPLLFVFSLLISNVAWADGSRFQVKPGPVYPETVQGTVNVTTFYCIALVGTDCPPPIVAVETADGQTLTLTGDMANELKAFDGKDVTLSGARYSDVLDVESFIVGHTDNDVVTGTVHVANNRNFPPDVYIEAGGRMLFVADREARIQLARAEGAMVSLEGDLLSPNHFRPTSTRFLVKGKVESLPQPLCLPGGPCGPFPTHAITLPNGERIRVIASIDNDDRYLGYGETRWFELEFDANRPDLFDAVSYSGVVYDAPAVDPMPIWPMADGSMGTSVDRNTNTMGALENANPTQTQYVQGQGMKRARN